MAWEGNDMQTACVRIRGGRSSEGAKTVAEQGGRAAGAQHGGMMQIDASRTLGVLD